MITVACVLKSGGDFNAEYVERLRDGAAKNLKGHRFLCLSDVDVPCERMPLRHDWPRWWSKMELFRPDLDGGDFLYFDLDTLIVGDLSEIARARDLTMLSDFFDSKRLASGVMYLPWFDRADVWRKWIKDPERHMRDFRGHGDGGFIGSVKGKAQRWQDDVPGQIVSYKAHVRAPQHPIEKGNGKIPKGARVVCFHGKPRPHEVQWTV